MQKYFIILILYLSTVLLPSAAHAWEPIRAEQECKTDTDCETGFCNGFSCILGACSASSDCADDQVCNLRDDPCAAYTNCSEEKCPKRCTKKQGTCQEFKNSCHADSDCGKYELCIVGRQFQCAQGDKEVKALFQLLSENVATIFGTNAIIQAMSNGATNNFPLHKCRRGFHER